MTVHWIAVPKDDRGASMVLWTEAQAEEARTMTRPMRRWTVEGPFVLEATTEGAVDTLARVKELAGWMLRDKREPDKVMAYALEMRLLAHRHQGGQ